MNENRQSSGAMAQNARPSPKTESITEIKEKSAKQQTGGANDQMLKALNNLGTIFEACMNKVTQSMTQEDEEPPSIGMDFDDAVLNMFAKDMS